MGSSIVAVARSVIFGYFTFFLLSLSCAHSINFNTVEIFGTVVSWCSIFKMAAFTSLATYAKKEISQRHRKDYYYAKKQPTFCRCEGASRSPNGLFKGSSNARRATVLSNSDRTEGSSSPASLK